MKRMIMILWAGSVVCGACSAWRQSERSHTASGEIAVIEARAGIRRDSSVARVGRLVRVDRSWEMVVPQSGSIYRHTERLHVVEEARSLSRSIEHHADVAQRREQVEAAEFHRAESRARGWPWWWLAIAVAIVAWLAARLFRVWPFK